jgi:hypothetical protein
MLLVSAKSKAVATAGGGLTMSNDTDRLREELAELGTQISAKIEEFRKQGVLHGAARQEAAELQVQHARVAKAAMTEPRSVVGAISDEATTDTEILKHAFQRWIARVDKASER